MTEVDNLPSIVIGKFKHVPDINERTNKRDFVAYVSVTFGEMITIHGLTVFKASQPCPQPG